MKIIKHDNKGRIIEDGERNWLGILKWRTLYKYDDNGNKIFEKYEDKEFGTISYSKFDKEGNIIEKLFIQQTSYGSTIKISKFSYASNSIIEERISMMSTAMGMIKIEKQYYNCDKNGISDEIPFDRYDCSVQEFEDAYSQTMASLNVFD